MGRQRTPSNHVPVLLQETIEALAVQPGGRYIDCTIGGGGHAAAILEHSSPGGQLLGIDADPEAIKTVRARLENYADSSLIINENFVNLHAICIKYDFFPVHGILFDLGLSSLQLDSSTRGFSFQHDEPLDMRLNPSQEITTADIVNTYSEIKLGQLIRAYGEEHHSHKIAHSIVQRRPVKTTFQLVKAIEQAAGSRRGKIHPATKTFQALRIAVNHELENLKSALKQAIKVLGFKGKLVIISYHSLEDRIVKQFLHQESKNCICPPETPTCICGHTASIRIVNKKIITPSQAEVRFNPRSRSGRLRTAERITTQDESSMAIEKLCFSTKRKANGWRKPIVLAKLRKAFSYPS